MANPIFNCPHCGARAQFNQETTARYNENYYTFTYNIYRCAACERLMLKVIRFWTQNGSDITLSGQYPNIYIAEINEFSGAVPEDVLQDFHEAIKCFEVEAYRASAALCRRSLQSAVIDRGATKTKKLVKQIDEIAVASDIKDWANQIRILGNWGAHPDDDILKDVDQATAKEIIDFIKSFFTYVYVMPKKVENSRVNKPKPSDPTNNE